MFYVLVSFNFKHQNFGSPEEAERYYLEHHVSLAKTLPGLRQYVIGFSVTPWPTAVKRHRAAILAFDSEDAMRRAYRTDVGKELSADEERLITDAVVIFLDESQQILG